MEKVLRALLIGEAAYEEQALAVPRRARPEEIRCDRHRRHSRMNSGNERLRLFLEPARDGCDGRGVLENVPEEWLGDANFANQADISSVERGHEGDAREPAEQRSEHPIGEPPVGVNQLRLEAAPRPNGMDEIGAEKSDEREPGGPGRSDIGRHVPRVCLLYTSDA